MSRWSADVQNIRNKKEMNIRCLVETEVDHGDVGRRPAREKAPGPADRLTRIPNADQAVQVVVAAAGAKAGADKERN